VLRKVAEQPLDQFAKEALFEPLGIQDWEWARFPNGDPGTSGSLHLRPRDLAKLGQLVLDGGAWQGRRIVSADWINQMTARQSPPGSRSGRSARMVTYGDKADHQSRTTRLIGSARLDAVGSVCLWCPALACSSRLPLASI
jgi:CubicO group peptidase (beta-lactamase class C family)